MERVTSIRKITGQNEDSQDLMLQVRDRGLCRQCEGCVAFCTSMQYEEIELQPDGLPSYQNGSGCSLDCGLCYMICPVTGDLKNEVREMVSWVPPHGRIMSAYVENGTNGNGRTREIPEPLTGMLLHLFDVGRIDGAIFTTKAFSEGNGAWLGTSRQEVMIMNEIAGDKISDVIKFSLPTYSEALVQARQKGLKRLAFVGMPCEIETTRNMQVLGIIPADIISYRLGMFCLTDSLSSKEQNIPGLTGQELSACDLCHEFSSELADISLGFVPGDSRSTVLIRTSLGMEAFMGAARRDMVDVASIPENSQSMQGIYELAARKKNLAKRTAVGQESKIKENVV